MYIHSAALEMKEAEVRQLRAHSGEPSLADGQLTGVARIAQLDTELKLARVHK